ncbi:MAG: hypothetical protein ABI171_05160 [Collimonas sp.]|uniref:hypothetical protein n=1 Tax=Collimonas sp. TaxID=1963772 RepID=UPI0032648EC9
MDQIQRETVSSIDRMLLANVLAILTHQVGSGVTSLQVARSIYLSIAADLHISLSTEELGNIDDQFKVAEKSYLALRR